MKTRIVSFVLGVLAVTGLSFSSVQAATRISGNGGYTLEKDKELSGTLYISQDRVTIDGTVKGDLVVVGDIISVNGEVTGSVLAIGSSLNVHGKVGGSVRSATQELFIDGEVAGDVTSVAQTFVLQKTGVVGDSLYFAGTSYTNEGTVKGELQKALTGDINEPTLADKVWAWLYSFLALGLLGAVVFSLQPHRMTSELEEQLRKSFPASFGVGLLTVIALPVLLIVLLVSQVGLWLGMLLLSLFVVACLLGAVDASYFLGRLVLTKGMVAAHYAVGVLLLGALIMTVLSSVSYLSFIPLLVFVAALGGRVIAFKRLLHFSNAGLHDEAR